MAIKHPPYFKWRNGRPRWEPGPGVRALGFAGRDLKDTAGAWLGLEAAFSAAAALNAEVAAGRISGAAYQKPGPAAHSVAALWQRYASSPKYLSLSPCSRRDYARKGRIFVDQFGHEPVATLQTEHIYCWWEQMHATRGHAMANGVIAVARACLSHARRIGWRRDNPAMKLDLVTLQPRVVIWSPAEVEHLVATADAMGLRSIGDAVVVALHTGQRQADVLALLHMRTVDGRVLFRQRKTGARVRVPHTDQLAARLDSIRQRRTGMIVVSLADHVVISEHAGQPYEESRFRKTFRKVRAAASIAMPAMAGKQFLDLRDTAITRLALAGCTTAEIRAISGHSLETITQVLRHYLANDDGLGRNAIDKLKLYMSEENIAI